MRGTEPGDTDNGRVDTAFRARFLPRATIILAAGEKRENKDKLVALGCTRRCVGIWHNCFVAKGIPGIDNDAPRSNPRAVVREECKAKLLHKTLQKPRLTRHRRACTSLPE